MTASALITVRYLCDQHNVYFKERCLFLPSPVLVIQGWTKDLLCSTELGLTLQRAKHSCSSGLSHMLNFKHVNSPTKIGKTNYVLRVKHGLKCTFGPQPEYSAPLQGWSASDQILFWKNLYSKKVKWPKKKKKILLHLSLGIIKLDPGQNFTIPTSTCSCSPRKGCNSSPWIKVFISIHLP